MFEVEKGTIWTADKPWHEKMADVEDAVGTPITWGLPLLLLILLLRVIFK